MADREMVIKGLVCSFSASGPSAQPPECPCCFRLIAEQKGTTCDAVVAEQAYELLKEQSKQRFFVDSDGKITPLPIQPQWHPFNPLEPDDTGLKDHNFYLVTVKGFGTPMKAMYHIDMPFGFLPPPTKDFDPYDVIAWRELPDNMNEEVMPDE